MFCNRISTRLAGLVALTGLGACGETPLSSGAPHLEIKVAPLDLPGIAFACYDVTVLNGALDPVWQRGDPALSYPSDPTTLCSTRFGNGAGGDISYVGPCDADAPAHTVRLVLDGLYGDDDADLGDYQNPCPPSAPCSLDALCVENADTPVSFNLTIMRRANQGFFDVAVNFDSIYCSSKVDCTYDDAGEEPIELLFDPDTGERTQTVVVGLACTAGPGAERETALFKSDVRVVCGEELVARGFGIDACLPDGSEFHGVAFQLTSNTVTIRGAQWEREDTTGFYPAAAFAPSGLPADYDEAGIGAILADPALDDVYGLGVVAKSRPFPAGLASFGAEGFAAGFEQLDVAIFRRTGSSWTFDRVLPRHAGHGTTIQFGGLDGSMNSEWLLTLDAIPMEGAITAPIRSYLHRRITTPDGSLAFYPPIALGTPTSFVYCWDQMPAGDLVVAQCWDGAAERPELVVWDLSQIVWTGTAPSPTTLPGEVLPSPVGDSSFPWSLAELEEIQRYDAISPVVGGAGDDRLFANLQVTPDSLGYGVGHLVHFRRDADDGWVVEAPPAVLALAGPDQNTQTGVRVQWPLGASGTVLAGDGGFDDGSYGRWVARYDAATGGFAEVVRLEDLGLTDVYDPHVHTAVADALGRVYLAGTALDVDPMTEPWDTTPWEELPWRPILIGPFFDADEPPTATWLPIPTDTTAIPLVGIRGPSEGLTLRLSGHVRDADDRLFVMNWDLSRLPAGGFTPVGYELLTPDVTLTTNPGDASDLNLHLRVGGEATPAFDIHAPRCRQTFDDFESDDEENIAIIFDPTIDNIDLEAVSFNDGPSITADGVTWSGTSVIRASADLPESVWPPLGDGDATFDLLNPAQPAEGNAWTAATRPAGLGAHIRQLASYHGEEALECDGASCNKVFWNTAIAFDPSHPDCELRFEATAAETGSLVGGRVPDDVVWPFIIGRVPLTGPADEDGEADLVCRRHPLGSDELGTLYKPQDATLPVAWGFTPDTSGDYAMTDLFGDDVDDAERRAFYVDLEWLIGGGVPGSDDP